MKNIAKKNLEIVEKERDMLKLTLDYVAKQNLELKQSNEDLKMTVKHSKEMLQEYIDNITNKDKIVQKMNNLIDQLNNRLNAAYDYIKKKQKEEKLIKEDDCFTNKNNFRKSNLTCNLELTCNTRTQTYNKSEANEFNNSNDLNLTEKLKTINNLSYLNLNYTPPKNLKNILNGGKIKSLDILNDNILANINNFKISGNHNNHDCVSCQEFLKKLKEEIIKEGKILKEELEEFKEEVRDVSHYNTFNNLNETQLYNLNHTKNNINNSNNNNNDCKNSKNIFSLLNLRRNYNFDYTKLGQFLNKNVNSCEENNIIIIKDDNHNFWEMIRRHDVKELNYENIKNIKSILSKGYYNKRNMQSTNKKENNKVKILDSSNFLDLSKLTDFDNLVNNQDSDKLHDY